jgi:hypothetical protein
MWENITEPDRPQMTVQGMRIPCWITKAIDPHSEYVTVFGFPRQQWLRERAPLFHYTHIACLFGVNVIVISYYLFPISFFCLMQGSFRAYYRSRIHVHWGTPLLKLKESV